MLPTTTVSCSSEQKTGPIYSSFAQLLQLPTNVGRYTSQCSQFAIVRTIRERQLLVTCPKSLRVREHITLVVRAEQLSQTRQLS